MTTRTDKTTTTTKRYELWIATGNGDELEIYSDGISLADGYAQLTDAYTPNALEMVEATAAEIRIDGTPIQGPVYIDVAEIERNQQRAALRERLILQAIDEEMGWN